MSGAATVAPQARTGAWPMYRAMVGVGLLCGVLIVTVYETTKPVIERNRQAALEVAILRVLPGAEASRAFRLDDESRFVPRAAGEAVGNDDGRQVYAAYDAAGALVGVAVEAAGMGYQDTIDVLWGYAPQTQTLVGLAVLNSRETPGLGDKIEKDPAFLENFERLDVSLDDTGAALRHPVVAVKHGAKSEDWEVDGITGATISSVAIADIIARSAARWTPLIHAQRDVFAVAPPEPAATEQP